MMREHQFDAIMMSRFGDAGLTIFMPLVSDLVASGWTLDETLGLIDWIVTPEHERRSRATSGSR